MDVEVEEVEVKVEKLRDWWIIATQRWKWRQRGKGWKI